MKGMEKSKFNIFTEFLPLAVAAIFLAALFLAPAFSLKEPDPLPPLTAEEIYRADQKGRQAVYFGPYGRLPELPEATSVAPPRTPPPIAE